MDEKDNTLLERGADNDVVRLRWRIKIRENVVARLVAENERLRNGRAESCETVARDEMSPPEGTDLRSITSHQESDEKRTNTTMNRDATPSGDGVQSRCALTDAEREAIAFFAELRGGDFDSCLPRASTLRNLLERIK